MRCPPSPIVPAAVLIGAIPLMAVGLRRGGAGVADPMGWPGILVASGAFAMVKGGGR